MIEIPGRQGEDGSIPPAYFKIRVDRFLPKPAPGPVHIQPLVADVGAQWEIGSENNPPGLTGREAAGISTVAHRIPETAVKILDKDCL
jgi:hypothetical protein